MRRRLVSPRRHAAKGKITVETKRLGLEKHVPKLGVHMSQIRLSSAAQSLMADLKAEDVITALQDLFSHAASINVKLQDCAYFNLLDGSHLNDLCQADGTADAWFWRQINQLLILLCRTNSRVALNLVDGFCQALDAQNELTLAFCGRALIEHAAAHSYLANKLAPSERRLATEIWPLRGTSAPCLVTTAEDICLRQVLIRFAVGRLVQRSDLAMPLPTAGMGDWMRLAESMRDVPERFRPVSIRDLIDGMIQTPGRQRLRHDYNLMSEYCHPNSASRTLDFHTEQTEFGNHVLFAPVGRKST